MEDAIYLSDIVNKVYIIIRNEEFKAEEQNVLDLKNKKNIEIINNSNVTKINGNERLESIEITDKNNNKKTIKIDGLFVAIGRIPENEVFKNLINLDNYGYIISDEKCHTNVDGIFVAGDNRTKELRQLVTAASDGAIAASEAIKYVNKN